MALGNSTTPATETRIKPNLSRTSDASATATGNQYTNKTSTTKIIGSYWRDRGKIFYQINTNIVTILEKTRYYLFILSILFFFFTSSIARTLILDNGQQVPLSLFHSFSHTHIHSGFSKLDNAQRFCLDITFGLAPAHLRRTPFFFFY